MKTKFKRQNRETRIVSDEHSFFELAREWDALADEAEVPVHCRFDWLYCWWEHFGRHPKRSLCIVAISRQGSLVGIAPFYLGRSKLGRVELETRLNLMGCGTDRNELLGFLNDYGYSDFLDIIAHPDHQEYVAGEIADLLQRNVFDADYVILQHVHEDSFVVRHLLPAVEKRNLSYHQKEIDECPYISLPGTMSEYIEQTGPSSRRRRLKKNLEAAGKKYTVRKIPSEVELPVSGPADTPPRNGTDHGTEEELMNGLNQVIRMHQGRWNSIGYPGAFYDCRHIHFVEDVSRRLYDKGWLRIGLAEDQQGCSAVRMAIHDGKSTYDWLSGFDDAYPSARHRPGLGLLARMIEDAIQQNSSTVELMRGAERYKFDFASESRKNRRITIPLGPRPGLLQKASFRFLHLFAKLYYRIVREGKLLDVQFKERGVVKMWYSYGKFRLGAITNRNGS